MPCFYPLQGFFSVRDDGTKEYTLSKSATDAFRFDALSKRDDSFAVPCGRCIGCRLERSRQWAVRMMHEAKMHDDTCFLTLTYDDNHLPIDGSLSKRAVQLFLKRLRQRFSDRKIRFFACGEYGEQFQRPHYHLCLFGIDFSDKVFYTRRNGNNYFNSAVVSVLWPFGFNVISDLTFDSAAYVARYCTKIISGACADEHYRGRQREFALMSRRPGIGMPWLEKYGLTDAWQHDEVVVNGIACKPPRYYDTKLEQFDPELYARVKDARRQRFLSAASDDTSYARLRVKEKCMLAKFKRLSREYESVASDKFF